MRALALAVVAAAVLAGCSDGEQKPAEVIIISGDTDTPTSAPAAATTSKEKGHIAGFVVDEAINPIRNASVHLTSLDLKDLTDRYGGFEFVDLPAGSYLLKFNATGHEDAQAVLDVEPGKFTRVKVILHRIPPPEPRITVTPFQGFAELTSSGILTTGLACDCTFPFQQDLNGLEAVVIEAVMDDGGNRGFHVYLETRECCTTIHSADLPNPFWTEVDGARIHDTELRVEVYPWSQPLPETNVSFQVFVSAFHNQQVPEGYTAL